MLDVPTLCLSYKIFDNTSRRWLDNCEQIAATHNNRNQLKLK